MDMELIEGFDNVACTWGLKGPKFWDRYGKRLVQLLNISEDSSILDVGTGRGACLFHFISKLSTSSRLVGIDASQKMIEYLKQDIKKRGLSAIEVFQMDAERMQFENCEFDIVSCGFGIPFFNIKEIVRVLKKKGRAGFSSFCKQDDDLSFLFKKILAPYLVNFQNQNKKNEKQENMLYSSDGIKNYLKSIGFSDVKINIEEDSFFYESKEEWWKEMDWWKELWPLYMRENYYGLKEKNPSLIESFKTEAFDLLDNFRNENGYIVKRSVMYSIATK